MNDDKLFADRLGKSVPSVAVPSSLEMRILADFDRLAVRRPAPGLMAWAVQWAERLWPGAPVWQPVGLLAASLIVGLTAGALVPSVMPNGSTVTDQTLVAADTPLAMDLYRDL